MASNQQIIQFLSKANVNAGLIDKLKIRYRPVICPFDILLNYANQTHSVFDIGCGSGQFCLLIANFTDVKKIKGIEINQQLIENANQINFALRKEKNIEFELFDGLKIPDDIKDYHLIYLIDVFHHIPKAIQFNFLKQVYEKMKPGSRLVFKDIDRDSPLVFFNKIHDLILSKEIGNEIGYSKARKLLQGLGFKILEESKKTVFVYPHYYILCEKI
jgi:2-polyprenyl-3-methyl-5-hydroxy-6-metoxy-1,4-benzoquinol methylase